MPLIEDRGGDLLALAMRQRGEDEVDAVERASSNRSIAASG